MSAPVTFQIIPSLTSEGVVELSFELKLALGICRFENKLVVALCSIPKILGPFIAKYLPKGFRPYIGDAYVGAAEEEEAEAEEVVPQIEG